MTTNHQDTFKNLFESAQEELLTAQNALSELIARTAADPWLETQQKQERERLTQQRDESLQKWSRLALSWMLRGGRFQMLDEHDSPTNIVLQKSPPQNHTSQNHTSSLDAHKNSRPDRSSGNRAEPIVQTIRRGRPEPRLNGTASAASKNGSYPSYRPQNHGPSARPGSAHPGSGFPSSQPNGWSHRPVINELDGEALYDLLDVLEEPDRLETLDDVREELQRLLRGTTSQHLLEWTSFPKTIQRSLVGHVVARARYVQDELKDLFPTDLGHDLDRIFSGMTAFSKREQPGFVFGLMRHHHPVGENWLSDAKKWWQDLINQLPEDIRPDPEGALDELRQLIEEDADEEEIIDQALAVLDDGMSVTDTRLLALLLPHKDLLGKHTQFKKLRKALREYENGVEE